MSDLGNRQIMSENVQYYMKTAGITRAELAAVLGVAYTTVSDWLTCRSYPRIDRIEAMARYFGIEKADLVERRGSVIPARSLVDGKIQIYVSAREELLIVNWRELGPNDKDLTLKLVQSLARKTK